MPREVRRKWRPPLVLVVAGTLAAVLVLPLFGVAYAQIAGDILRRRQTVILIGCIAGVTAAVLGFLLWRLVLRPVNALTDYARAIARGHGDPVRPAHFGTAEFSQLAQSVIDMGTTLNNREAVLRSYADHVTHELKSPLTVLRGAAELLDSPGLKAADRRALLTRIDGAADRMTALLDAQRALARAQEPLAEGTCRVAPLMAELQREHPGVTLELASDGDLPIAAAGVRLVLTHLLANAEAHGASKVVIDASPEFLRVADDGPGISPGNRARVFDPFFTTRRESGGTGMGLPIVKRMLQAHGADIRLAEGPGAVFEVVF